MVDKVKNKVARGFTLLWNIEIRINLVGFDKMGHQAKISNRRAFIGITVFLNIMISLSLLFIKIFKNDDKHSQRVVQVSKMKGLIAFWDFSHKKKGMWTSFHDKSIVNTGYEIVLRRIGDDQAYTPTDWPYDDVNSQLMFDTSGPFGNAVRFNKGYIFGEVPRSAFDQTPLDINNNQPFTLIAWCKFIGKRHLVAGIWDEGGWKKYGGRRQIALFGGLFDSKGTIGHVSATGASSYPQSSIEGSQYARMRAIDGQEFENDQWVAMAMTFDPRTKMVTAYLDGDSTQTYITDPVANDVFQHSQPISSNPFYFPWPIFSPRSFVLKFNGHNNQLSGVYERWIEVDIVSFTIKYGQNDKEGITENQEYKIHFDVHRKGNSVLPSPIEFLAKDGRTVQGPETITIQTGDRIIASLYRQNKDEWQQISSTINYQIREGAPFTFGRALGLGNESISEGSQLYIDGVAVFNRVLGRKELEEISF